MTGFRVTPITGAAPIGDTLVTIAGNREVIDVEHLAVMEDGRYRM